MTFEFPHSKPRKLGYKPEAVDAFIAKAREEFTQNGIGQTLDISGQEFPLVKGGYSVTAVDVALDRLEDAFAARINKTRIDRSGTEGLVARANEIKVSLIGRLERKKRKRFNRTGLILRGYSRREVDKFLDKVARHIDTRSELTVDEVRRVLFTPKRGGYAENQVDAFIERIIELLQIEKVL